MRHIALLLFLFLATTVPRTVRAQGVAEEEMRDMLSQLSGEGWSLFDIKRGLLEPGSARVFGHEIPAGTREILVFAVCDGDCNTIYLEVASESGRIGQNTQSDRPVLTIRGLTGLLGVRITMAQCSAATCAYRAVVLTK